MPHARKQRKKAKLPALPKDAVPEPFLALAPAPVATPSPQPDQRAGVGNLILPSDYVRSVTSSQSRYSSALVSPPTVIAGRNRPAPQPRPLPTPAPLQQRGYVTNLLSPPFVVPGGRPASPLPQLSAPTRPPLIHQSSSRDGRTGRELPRTGRQSPAPPETPAEQQPAQSGPTRRRGQRPRVVNGSISRRSTVVSREDHLSRRASMRRVNVWDGESSFRVVVSYRKLTEQISQTRQILRPPSPSRRRVMRACPPPSPPSISHRHRIRRWDLSSRAAHHQTSSHIRHILHHDPALHHDHTRHRQLLMKLSRSRPRAHQHCPAGQRPKRLRSFPGWPRLRVFRT
jgi:hypothetical protein